MTVVEPFHRVSPWAPSGRAWGAGTPEVAARVVWFLMRIALISDLHGNALALRETLSRIAHDGADRVICLGDVATLGPEPERVLELLHDSGAVCILGNHDEFLLRPDLVASYTSIQVIADAIDWCRSRLSAASLQLIRSFRDSYELPLHDGGALLTFHGTPSSNTTDLLATTDPETVERWIGAVNGNVLAGGHTHVQMLRQHRGRLLVNPGSVGMPFREVVADAPPVILPHAEYAIVDFGPSALNVSLRRVPLDRAQLRAAALAVDFPLSSFLADAYA